MENDNFIEGKQSWKTTVPDAYYEATVIRTAVSAQGWTNRLVAHIKSLETDPHNSGHFLYDKSGMCRAVGSSLFINWYWAN